LLDTGVLIALCNPSYAMRTTAKRLLESHEGNIATCPIVENAAARILSQPRYSDRYRISTAQDAVAAAKVRNIEGYDF
jgi:predicted nucleic acid-binding protein